MEVGIQVACSIIPERWIPNSRLFLGVLFAWEPIAPRTSVVHYESTRVATHIHAHTHIRTPVPAEDLPEIRNVSSGDTWGATPGSSDRRYDKSTVSLLLSSGIRTAHFPEELFPGERGNLPWGDTGEMDGQETEITPALRRRHGSNLLSLNADPPGARAVARP